MMNDNADDDERVEERENRTQRRETKGRGLS
jgi:hypothetical protein